MRLIENILCHSGNTGAISGNTAVFFRLSHMIIDHSPQIHTTFWRVSIHGVNSQHKKIHYSHVGLHVHIQGRFGAIEIAPGTTDPTLSHSVIKVHFMTLPKRKKCMAIQAPTKKIKSLPKEKHKLEQSCCQCKKHKFDTTPHSTRLFTGLWFSFRLKPPKEWSKGECHQT